MLYYVLGAIFAFIIAMALVLFKTMARMCKEVKVVDPLPEQRKRAEKHYIRSPLYTRVPELQGKLPWEPSLREIDESPVDWLQLHLPGANKTVTISVKREGLLSTKYGGNKVRTLEHLLPTAVAQMKLEGRKGHFVGLGAPGSNQVTAMAAHAAAANADIRFMFIAPEGDSPDNALNLASVLSYPYAVLDTTHSLLLAFYRVVKLTWFEKDNLVCPLGGAAVPGVFGHINAVLELADQIERGYAHDPTDIYLALGSGCTTAGLMCGIAVSRTLGGRKAFSKPVKIHATIIHHLFAKIPFMVKNKTEKLAKATLRELKRLTGLDALPEFVENVLPYVYFEGKFAGQYGSPTDEMLMAKVVFEDGTHHHRSMERNVEGENSDTTDSQRNEKVSANGTTKPTKPWYCSTFSGKGAAFLLSNLEIIAAEQSNTQPLIASVVQQKQMSSETKADDKIAPQSSTKSAGTGTRKIAKGDGSFGMYDHDSNASEKVTGFDTRSVEHLDMKNILFWSTKSCVQPFANDGFNSLFARADTDITPAMREWLYKGGVVDHKALSSVLRNTRHNMQ
ncbi:hypothetical protein SARC_04444 [Sphaeroforma arctica JP610]|uniref:Tryptophan synthase beta chain-like PALP domain-containing protein n=1 Tax=Sphaeroforma arctica JP610 TaxID=667725 RepID=A0A0L0G2K0_9EUKA|nr:hypothetical protein SARC_04444 [Sphaeroforma arctica JP610]KNC83300.1 hypothetical protein SARC_04444 [Sphaeroforma arctica JP610]|eukprot:XP_014157202.1 hypothetical protein SARC_04444 [Sphaeroforma arctica JP610]